MLVFDRSKTQVLSANSAAPWAMVRGYRGMGLNTQTIQAANQFNPEPISRAAIDVITSITNFLGIGRGRAEADEIVPIQNYIHYNILKPIAEAVNADYAEALSKSQLNEMLDALLQTKDNWLHFLHDTQWTDGRAAVQAENDLAFLFDDQQLKIERLLPNAPYFSNVEPPVYTPYTPGGGSSGRGAPSGTVRRTTTGSSVMSTTQNYLPWILAGAFLFMLPKVGKWNGR